MPSFGSTPVSPSTSPTLTALDSAQRTRTRTDCCASTSRKAPTFRGGAPRTSQQSHRRSTRGLVRHSTGRRQPKRSTTTSSRSKQPRDDPHSSAQQRCGRPIDYLHSAVPTAPRTKAVEMTRRSATAWTAPVRARPHHHSHDHNTLSFFLSSTRRSIHLRCLDKTVLRRPVELGVCLTLGGALRAPRHDDNF